MGLYDRDYMREKHKSKIVDFNKKQLISGNKCIIIIVIAFILGFILGKIL